MSLSVVNNCGGFAWPDSGQRLKFTFRGGVYVDHLSLPHKSRLRESRLTGTQFPALPYHHPRQLTAKHRSSFDGAFLLVS